MPIDSSNLSVFTREWGSVWSWAVRNFPRVRGIFRHLPQICHAAHHRLCGVGSKHVAEHEE
jgi:hypothetical protein